MLQKLKIIFVLIFFVPIFSFAQEDEDGQFVRKFTKVVIIENGQKKEHHTSTGVTFIFNYGDGSDIKVYYPSGKIEKYTRVSEVEEGKLDDLGKYQKIIIINDKGEECSLVLFDSGLLMLLFDKSNQAHFYP
ncbi:MAG: hypothetical protein Q4C75_02095 [Bergeyella zoohelcum]|nr:hypothetical protein [Bergeyella zoohelcum]